MKKLIECLNPRCKKKFWVKIIKKYFVSRKGETEEKVTVEKLPDGTEKKHIKKVPAAPFLRTTSFQEAQKYQDNPKYVVDKKLQPKSVFCQRCRNMASRRAERIRMRKVAEKRRERKLHMEPISKKEAEELEKEIANQPVITEDMRRKAGVK